MSQVCSQIVLKCSYLARIGRPDILWSVNKFARSITKWTKACDKRLNRLISYIHHTCAYKQYCYVGNTAKQCRLGLFQGSDFAGDHEDSKSTSGGTLCIFGSHTFVPISSMCKKQTSVSHSSTESELISLDGQGDGVPKGVSKTGGGGLARVPNLRVCKHLFDFGVAHAGGEGRINVLPWYRPVGVAKKLPVIRKGGRARLPKKGKWPPRGTGTTVLTYPASVDRPPSHSIFSHALYTCVYTTLWLKAQGVARRVFIKSAHPHVITCLIVCYLSLF